jgi:type IV secretion system protein VirB6
MLNWSAILLLLIAAGPLLAAKIVLGILLALGPIFILLGLFAFTRGLATGWLRAAAFLALVPMLSALSTAGALLLIGPLVDRIVADAADGRFSTLQALGLFAGLIVLAGATLLLLRVAHMIASGWTIELRRAADPPESAALADRPGSTASLAMPRADQIAFAIERAAASDPARLALTTPAPFRIEIPSASAGSSSAEPVPGRRIGQSALQTGLPSAIRPLRAGEAL